MENLFQKLSIPTPYEANHADFIFRFLLYSVLIIVAIIQTLCFFKKANAEKKKSMIGREILWYYKIALIGICLMIGNLFFSSMSMYLTHGKFMLFGHQKSILYLSGNLLLFFGLVKISLSVISLTQRTQKIFLMAFNFTVAIGIIGFITIIWNFLEPSTLFLNENIDKILAGFGFLFLSVLILTTLFLLREFENNPSKMESLRIKLLLTGIMVQIGQLIARIAILVFESNSRIMKIFSFYVSPLIDFIGYPISIFFIWWSIFTPNWLYIRSGVVPKEFAKILKE